MVADCSAAAASIVIERNQAVNGRENPSIPPVDWDLALAKSLVASGQLAQDQVQTWLGRATALPVEGQSQTSRDRARALRDPA
jgi:hypothetical protein